MKLSSRFKAACLCWTLLCSLAFIGGLTRRDRAVGMVLFNTLHSTETETPEDDEISRYKREFGDDSGNSYGFSSVSRTRDGKRYRWNAKVAYLPLNWKPAPEVEARWRKRLISEEGEAPAIYYEFDKHDKSKAARISYKQRVGQTQLTLQDTRTGATSLANHLKLSRPRWDRFVGLARRYEVLKEEEPAETALFVELPDTPLYTGEEAINGGVFSIDQDLNQAVRFPIVVDVRVDDELPPEPLRLVVQVTSGDAAVRLTGRNSEGDGNRRVFSVGPRNGRAEMEVFFAAVPKAERERLIGQTAEVAMWIEGQEDKTRFIYTLHRTTWIPVLRQLELIQTNPSRRTLKPVEDTLFDDRARDPRIFNARRHLAASEVKAWRKLAPTVAIRQSLETDAPAGQWAGEDRPVIGDEEPVILGFQLDEVSGASYHVAENSPKAKNTLATWLDAAHMELRFEAVARPRSDTAGRGRA